MLGWLDTQGHEYIFNGDGQTKIDGVSSLMNHKGGFLTWIKAEECYNNLNKQRDISCAVVQSGASVDFENAIVAEHSKEVFFTIVREFWGEKKKGR